MALIRQPPPPSGSCCTGEVGALDKIIVVIFYQNESNKLRDVRQLFNFYLQDFIK